MRLEVKYEYEGTAEIDFGRGTMGDRYLEFNASGLISTDQGVPVLGEMTVIAGVDILGTLETQKGPLEDTDQRNHRSGRRWRNLPG